MARKKKESEPFVPPPQATMSPTLGEALQMAARAVAEGEAKQAQAKKPKYGNRKTVVDGIAFDSAKEARRYGELKAMEAAGEIEGLETQPEYRLEVGGQLVCRYVGDFRYRRGGETVVEDTKSGPTAKNRAYRIKLKLLKALTGIEIREV